ncbi:signal peptide protein [Rhodopirellula europaea 6C]|uniref:Signal peptide protein n=2 Tax=Rhodopirellula TaxID=265488 RepID=M2B5U8_9BACT|nr:signal peptide protein [Rhodopirellula europaea 6C]
MLNLSIESTSTMIRPIRYLLLLSIIFAGGCTSETNSTTAGNPSAASKESPSESLDFDALLIAVDNAIGKRFQAMQMDAMNSASYQYDGPIKTVVDIVDPIAKKAGFTPTEERPSDSMGEAEKEMQAKMGINMNSIDRKMYTHPNGDTLMIARMDMSNDDIDMKMLTVQRMNPKKMADLSAENQNP